MILSALNSSTILQNVTKYSSYLAQETNAQIPQSFINRKTSLEKLETYSNIHQH